MKLQWIKDILGDAYTEELDARVSAALGERSMKKYLLFSVRHGIIIRLLMVPVRPLL